MLKEKCNYSKTKEAIKYEILAGVGDEDIKREVLSTKDVCTGHHLR